MAGLVFNAQAFTVLLKAPRAEKLNLRWPGLNAECGGNAAMSSDECDLYNCAPL